MHRVPGRQHAQGRAAAPGNVVDQERERPGPGQSLAPIIGHHGQVAGATHQHLRPVHEGTGFRAEAVEPVLAQADDGKPGLHRVQAPARALTAAAASALPPRRPRSVR